MIKKTTMSFKDIEAYITFIDLFQLTNIGDEVVFNGCLIEFFDPLSGKVN